MKKHVYEIDVINDDTKRRYIGEAKNAIDRLRIERERLQKEIERGHVDSEIKDDKSLVWWLCQVLDMRKTASQIEICGPKDGESYYKAFIPLKYEGYVGTDNANKILIIHHRVSDHIHSNSVSDSMEGFKHPNIRAESRFMINTLKESPYWNCNGVRIKKIWQNIPSSQLTQNEDLISLINSLIYLYKEGKFGNINRNKPVSKLKGEYTGKPCEGEKNTSPSSRQDEHIFRVTDSELCRIVESVLQEIRHRKGNQSINENFYNPATESMIDGHIGDYDVLDGDWRQSKPHGLEHIGCGLQDVRMYDNGEDTIALWRRCDNFKYFYAKIVPERGSKTKWQMMRLSEVPGIIKKDFETINPRGHEPYLRC